MAENQVQSEKKMTSLNVSSATRDAIKDISTSLGLSQADTVARLVDGYHPNATPGVKAALDASAVLDEAVERVKRIIVGAAEAAAMEARAAREDADAAKKSAMEQIQGIKSNGSVRPGLTFRPVIFLRLHNGRPLSNLNPARGDAPETGRVARLALPFHADLPANSPSPRRAPAS